MKYFTDYFDFVHKIAFDWFIIKSDLYFIFHFEDFVYSIYVKNKYYYKLH
jgi:hypothetical protein